VSNFVAKYISPFLKSHVAGLGTAAALLISDIYALKPGQNVTLLEWIAIGGAYLGVGAATWVTPNLLHPGSSVIVPVSVPAPAPVVQDVPVVVTQDSAPVVLSDAPTTDTAPVVQDDGAPVVTA
jgi:hypothetical protein